jgi:hypothetical protein
VITLKIAIICAAAVVLMLSNDARAASSVGQSTASAAVSFQITIPAVFRIISATKVPPDSIELRVWTNERSTTLNGHFIRFDKVGEQSVFIADGAAGDHPLTIVSP